MRKTLLCSFTIFTASVIAYTQTAQVPNPPPAESTTSEATPLPPPSSETSQNTTVEGPPVSAPPAAPQSDLVFVPPPPPKAPLTAEERRQRREDAKRLREERRSGKPPARTGSSFAKTKSGDELEFKIKTDVELVLLDVSVKDSQGGFVSGLQKENFQVFDDNAVQDLTVFQSLDVPVTVGLVVDNSGSVRPKKPEIVTAALTFVRESNPKDEMFVVNFNDRVLKGLPQGVDFTDQHKLLRDALLLNPAQGRTALYDGLKSALEHLDKGRLAKKTLVLIADGGDNMSDTSREEILNLIEESLATIYTVGIYNPDDKDKNPGFLKQIAKISGGEYYHPPDISHLVSVCEKIAKDIRNRYTLGYTPKNRNFDGRIRKLKVVATQPDGRKLEVRTRDQYVAATRESPREEQ
jgi:VWFA-related protein